MGNSKSGTLGKLSRRVRRNHERSMKARGVREKKILHENFKKAFNLGAEMLKIRILNATAGYEYEPEAIPAAAPYSGNVDSMSESTLGSDVLPEVDGQLIDKEHFNLVDPNDPDITGADVT